MATSGNDLDWDALSLDDSEKQQYVVNEEPEEQKFRKIIVYDIKSKNEINHQIYSLQATFESCENVFKAVYDVLRYFPNLDNPNSDYWKKEVIPNLSVCLKQHVEARIFFYGAFGTINDLKNTLFTAAQVIKQSKGDPSAVETAQTYVREMLNELEDSIKKAENLSDSAYKTFGAQVDNISKLIIGEKTVSFNKEHSCNRIELTKLYNMRYNMYAELEDLQAETNRYQCLIDATQPHIDSKKSEISKINEEREQLKMLNEEINKKLQDIPENSNRFSIFGLKLHFKPTMWTLEASKSQIECYQNMINARLSQIKDSEDSKEAKEKSQRELTEYMEECKKKRDLAKSTLEIKKKDIENNMPAIKKRIENLHELENQLIENERKTYDKVGLRGDVLVKALNSIRTFSEIVGKEASAYEPLKAFLKSIKRMVQIDVDLLLKSDKPSIFIAVNRILDNIKELSKYYDSVGSLMQQLNETKTLNSIPNAIE